MEETAEGLAIAAATREAARQKKRMLEQQVGMHGFRKLRLS